MESKKRPVIPEIENPYNKSIPIVWMLILFFSIPLLLKIIGFLEDTPIIVTIIPAIFFLFVQIITMIMAWNMDSQMNGFLSSDRVLMSWTYSLEDSKKIRKELFEESKDDFNFILYGATILFGITGSITGIMPGMNFLLCLGIGLGFGAGIGLVLGYGKKIENEKDYVSKKQINFAIGKEEILYKDRYFKVNESGGFERRVILNIILDKKHSKLTISVKTDRFRHHNRGDWIIGIPEEYVEKLETLLPKIKVNKEESHEGSKDEEVDEEELTKDIDEKESVDIIK